MFFKNQSTSKQEINTLFIIDVLYMRDINAVYGYKNGNNILEQLLFLLNKGVLNKIK